MKLKGAIFDLDGTLLDSMPVWDDICYLYLKSHGITPANDLREQMKTRSLLQCAQFFREEYNLAFTEELIMEQVNRMLEDQYMNHITVKPHVPEFLQVLRESGVKACIATATDRYLVEAALKRLKLDHYFSFIITCGEVGCGKDQGIIFQKALQQLGTAQEETVVFEDALHAIKSAKEAGFLVIGVYDLSAQKDLMEIKEIADRFIYSFKEVEVTKLL